VELDQHIQEKFKRLLHWVNGIPNLSVVHVGDKMFPSDIILSIHNKLGTIHQLLSDAGTGFNAQSRTSDFERVMYLSGELRGDWLSAKMTHLLNHVEYTRLDELTRQVIDAVKANVDDEAKW
jgi:hypothetical protein